MAGPFQEMAKRHRDKYLPALSSGLKKAGTWETETNQAAETAAEQLAIMVSRGTQYHAAREWVLKEYILLPPETTEEPEDGGADSLEDVDYISNESIEVPIIGTSTEKTDRDDRFIAYSNGTVLDTQTNLMWAARDNGSNITWHGAKSYCENYHGGGYTDWRMPTQDELAGLYDANKSRPGTCDSNYIIHVATDLIDITGFWSWASDMRDSAAAVFHFYTGFRRWHPQSFGNYSRAHPVRSAK